MICFVCTLWSIINLNTRHQKFSPRNISSYIDIFKGPVAQSVQRLATGWTVWGSNPGGARFSAPVQTGPGAHPASCTMGTGSFPGVESGRGVTVTRHPLLVPRRRAIPLLSLRAFVAYKKGWNKPYSYISLIDSWSHVSEHYRQQNEKVLKQLLPFYCDTMYSFFLLYCTSVAVSCFVQ
jgi:hypothetical protein